MIRTQIQLSREQAQKVKRIAAERSMSMAEIIRRALDSFLSSEQTPNRDERRARAAAAAGLYHAGIDDLAENHDDHFSDSIDAGKSV